MGAASLNWVRFLAHCGGVLALLIGVGCGDFTSSSGELGKVTYSLYTHYDSEDLDLSESPLLIGHPQTLRTQLTAEGAKEVSDPSSLTHQVTPSEGVTLAPLDDGFDVPDLRLTATISGTYTVETRLGGVLLDRIELTFEQPESLEVITWVKRSTDSDFQRVGSDGVILLDEGSQVTVIPVPKGADGRRLLGDFEATISPTPEGAVVRAANILGVYEEDVWSTADPVNLVFINPGEVSIRVGDPVNGVESVLMFSVSAAL